MYIISNIYKTRYPSILPKQSKTKHILLIIIIIFVFKYLQLQIICVDLLYLHNTVLALMQENILKKKIHIYKHRTRA